MITVFPKPSSDRSRAVSTVIDVSLALLLISASVVLIATSLNSEQSQSKSATVGADHAAETLAGTTASVAYSVAPVTSDSEFPNNGYTDATLTRTSHGSPADLLGEAAVANTKVSGTRITNAGTNFEKAVESPTLNLFTGPELDVYITAVWRPFEGSSIEGEATAGSRPPGDADVSSAVLTVDSGIPATDTGEVEHGFETDNDPFVGAARPIARAIVRGYFPPTATQHALERQGIRRALTIYKYRRMQTVVKSATGSGFSYPTAANTILGTRTVVDRTGADVALANEKVVEELTPIIASDLRNEFGKDATASEIANATTTAEVEIVVKTW